MPAVQPVEEGKRDRSCALGVSLPRSDMSNSSGFEGSCCIPPRAGSSAALPARGGSRVWLLIPPLGGSYPIPLQGQWGRREPG